MIAELTQAHAVGNLTAGIWDKPKSSAEKWATTLWAVWDQWHVPLTRLKFEHVSIFTLNGRCEARTLRGDES